jgi:hypothetical protein
MPMPLPMHLAHFALRILFCLCFLDTALHCAALHYNASKQHVLSK